jgi:hypothetical protein
LEGVGTQGELVAGGEDTETLRLEPPSTATEKRGAGIGSRADVIGMVLPGGGGKYKEAEELLGSAN